MRKPRAKQFRASLFRIILKTRGALRGPASTGFRKVKKYMQKFAKINLTFAAKCGKRAARAEPTTGKLDFPTGAERTKLSTELSTPVDNFVVKKQQK